MYKSKAYAAARKYGYRSGLEQTVSKELKDAKVEFEYENLKIEWEDLSYRTYTPDFLLPNGILIETKGMFNTDDRQKHLAIKKQHPQLDIRFVFTSSKKKLRKGSKTSYGQWCDKHGFLYADKSIPEEWINEPKKRGKAMPQSFNEFPLKKIERKF